jgi:hypothetical protein
MPHVVSIQEIYKLVNNLQRNVGKMMESLLLHLVKKDFVLITLWLLKMVFVKLLRVVVELMEKDAFINPSLVLHIVEYKVNVENSLGVI